MSEIPHLLVHEHADNVGVVVVEGLRFGMRIRSAMDQSKKSAESCPSQDARSSVSVAKLGIGLDMSGIMGFLLVAHVACEKNADQGSRRAQGETNVRHPANVGMAESMKSRLFGAVLQVRHQQQGVAKELVQLPTG